MALVSTLSSQLSSPGDERMFALLHAKLSGEEQQLFVNGFSQFISCNPNTEFVVSFEFAFEWLGFTRNDSAKRKLVNTLTVEVDYKISLHRPVERDAPENWGGQNKETIMLTVNGFKTFCMMAGTEKAKRVRQYYIAIENVMFEYTKTVLTDMEFAKAYSRHKTLVACNDMVSVVYLGFVTLNGVQYLKPGHTIDPRTRGSMLRSEYGHTFVFLEVLPCERAHQFEQWLLTTSELAPFRRSVDLDGHAKTELLRLVDGGGLTKERAAKVVRDNVHRFRNSEAANQVEQARHYYHACKQRSFCGTHRPAAGPPRSRCPGPAASSG